MLASGYKPLISLIVLNYNGAGILSDCLSSILQNDYENFEVILVDNGSQDRSMDEAQRQFGHDQRMRFLRIKPNLNYTGGMNVGLKEASGEWVVLLGNDTQLESDFLTELASGLRDKDIGAAAPKIFITGRPNILENTGGLLDTFGFAKMRGRAEQDRQQYDTDNHIFFASGAAPIYRRDILLEVGFLDRKFMTHSEDVDLCWRIRLRGYKIIFLPRARLWHKISVTTAKYTKKHSLLFHIRKNRIAVLIKNYNSFNLFKALPPLFLLYGLVFIKELLSEHNSKVAFTSISALFWNIKELPYLLKERRFIQKKIRKVPDRQIIRFMHPESIMFNQYIIPFLKGTEAS